MNTFNKGDKVRIINHPDADWTGRICTYNQPDETGNQHLVVDDIRDTMGIGKWVPTGHLELLTNTYDEYAGLSQDEIIANLTDHLYSLSKSTEGVITLNTRLQSDLDHYTTVMRDTKDLEGWCDDGTNKVIAALNEGFMAYYIEPYESEFEIEYEITAGVTTRGSVMITASSEDAAREFFDDDPESFITPDSEALDEARSTGWDSCEVESI